MIKKSKINLSIPNPCAEDWNKMTPDERGRFCSHCSKSVIDFSKFTDRELLDFFTKTTGKVCGKVSNHQLNRLIVASEPSDTSVFRRLLLGAALTAGVAGIAQGQSVSNNIHSTPQRQNDTARKIADDTTHKPAHYINGTIIDDSTKLPIPYCQVVMEVNGIPTAGTEADSNGHFQIPITDDILHEQLAILIEMMGYKDFQKELLPGEVQNGSNTYHVKMIAVELSAPVGVIHISPSPLLPNNPDEYTIKKGDTPYW